MTRLVGCSAALLLVVGCAQDSSYDPASYIEEQGLELAQANVKDKKKNKKDVCANLRPADGEGEMDILLERLSVTSVIYEITYASGDEREYATSFRRGISFQQMCEEVVDLGITSEDKDILALSFFLDGFVTFEEDIDSALVRVATSAEVETFRLKGRECKEVKHGDRSYAAALECSGKSGRDGKFEPAFEANKDYDLELELKFDKRDLKEFDADAAELSDLQIGLVAD